LWCNFWQRWPFLTPILRSWVTTPAL
jgi:hypothetical protein